MCEKGLTLTHLLTGHTRTIREFGLPWAVASNTEASTTTTKKKLAKLPVSSMESTIRLYDTNFHDKLTVYFEPKGDKHEKLTIKKDC